MRNSSAWNHSALFVVLACAPPASNAVLGAKYIGCIVTVFLWDSTTAVARTIFAVDASRHSKVPGRCLILRAGSVAVMWSTMTARYGARSAGDPGTFFVWSQAIRQHTQTYYQPTSNARTYARSHGAAGDVNREWIHYHWNPRPPCPRLSSRYRCGRAGSWWHLTRTLHCGCHQITRT